jgi:hypothetical protein
MKKTMGKYIVVFLATSLFLPGLVRPAMACHCPPCYRQTESGGCVFDCTAGDGCCNYHNCKSCDWGTGRCYYYCEDGTTCCYDGACCDPHRCRSCVSGHCRKCNGDPNYDCCNGECYDKRIKKCCKDGEKEWICEKYKECCNGSCCDPNECKSCVDGECKVCGGDPTKKCCNGTCEPKCEEVSSETPCSSTKNTSCLGCVGLFGDCHNACYSYHYLNTPIYACNGGCPGECDWEEPDPDCYDVYYCDNYIHYTFAECTSCPGGEIYCPVPLDCYEEDVMPWSCTRCQEGGYYKTETVSSRRCH